MKYGSPQWKYGGLQRKYGVSNENLGVSNEMFIGVSNSTPMIMISSQTRNRSGIVYHKTNEVY